MTRDAEERWATIHRQLCNQQAQAGVADFAGVRRLHPPVGPSNGEKLPELLIGDDTIGCLSVKPDDTVTCWAESKDIATGIIPGAYRWALWELADQLQRDRT